MTTIKSILRCLGATVRRKAAEREIEDELRFHIEMRTRDNIAAGMSAEDAAADAMRRFGDFDQIRAICGEIKKERLASMLKLMKGGACIMLGCGLTLQLTADIGSVRAVSIFLILIACLWLLLIHLREIRPDQHRIQHRSKDAEQSLLSITGATHDFPSSSIGERPFSSVPTYDKDGRTPVERLLSDEE